MKHKNNSGFTIIELIVVIAIIAILATIVMVNVVKYISDAKDAAIRADMETLITSSTIYFTNPTNSNKHGLDFLQDQNTTSTLTAISNLYPGSDHVPVVDYNQSDSTRDSWIVCAFLHADNKSFCVDSTGTKHEESDCNSFGHPDASGNPVCN